MTNDPGETVNLVTRPGNERLLEVHRQTLARRLRALDDTFVVPGAEYDGWTLESAAPSRPEPEEIR